MLSRRTLWLSCFCIMITRCVSLNFDKIGGANQQCMIDNCLNETIECFDNKICRDLIACSSYCMETWDKDNTTQKVHAQNCTLKCSASYEDNISDAYMACLFKYDCIDFPPINVSCPVSDLASHLDPNASIGTLAGEWWQQYGYNPLWDCYPCQHIHSMKPINSTNWNYTYSYEIYLVNNTLDYMEQNWILPNNSLGTIINITYEYIGTPHNESWYILTHKENRYVVLVDCSYISTWTNVGSIVWTRPNVELTNDELNDISNVYNKALGWQFPKQFCQTQHGSTCPHSSNSNSQKHGHDRDRDRARNRVQQASHSQYLGKMNN